jgi:hypothetical protein
MVKPKAKQKKYVEINQKQKKEKYIQINPMHGKILNTFI